MPLDEAPRRFSASKSNGPTPNDSVAGEKASARAGRLTDRGCAVTEEYCGTFELH